MSISAYLMEQWRLLIQRHRLGFDPNPARIPRPNLVANLSELRRSEFLNFRKELKFDNVVIIKVLTAVDLLALQEGIAICNLRGDAQFINLTEISAMTEEERRQGEILNDLKTLLSDPNTFKIVDNVANLVRFGERVFHRLEAEGFVGLDSWHPKLRLGFVPTVKMEYPQKYAALTLPFKGERHSGWRWGFGQDPEIMSGEQVRLGYAITSSLISLTLDGIVYRMYGHVYERQPVAKLAECMMEIVNEEVILFLETRQLAAVELKDNEEAKEEPPCTEPRKLRFMVFEGVRLAESLPFGLCREEEVGHIHDKSSRILIPKRHHIQSIEEWEESLELLHIVPAIPMVQHEVWEFGQPERSSLKPFKLDDIRIYKYGDQLNTDQVTGCQKTGALGEI